MEAMITKELMLGNALPNRVMLIFYLFSRNVFSHSSWARA